MPDPHPLLGALAAVVGAWEGDGTGHLPGEPDFAWHERLTCTTPGTPVLSFQQRTTHPEGGPFHAEDGWVRVPPDLQGDPGHATVELAVASPTGVIEALAGTLQATADGFVLDVASTVVAGTPAAGKVLDTRRRWTFDGDDLVIDFWMATPRHPDRFHHLTTRLRRAA